MVSLALEIIGALLLVVGVAVFCWPAALIVAGLLVFGFGFALEYVRSS